MEEKVKEIIMECDTVEELLDNLPFIVGKEIDLTEFAISYEQ